MGSRKNKNSSKCVHYDRGYCFKGDDCSEEHPDKVCPRCKFNAKKICLFSHVTIASEDERKIGEVKKHIAAVEKENKVLLTMNS